MKPELYIRMNNGRIFKSYMKMITEAEEQVSKELFANMTRDCIDHPKYSQVKEAYDNRFVQK